MVVGILPRNCSCSSDCRSICVSPRFWSGRARYVCGPGALACQMASSLARCVVNGMARGCPVCGCVCLLLCASVAPSSSARLVVSATALAMQSVARRPVRHRTCCGTNLGMSECCMRSPLDRSASRVCQAEAYGAASGQSCCQTVCGGRKAAPSHSRGLLLRCVCAGVWRRAVLAPLAQHVLQAVRRPHAGMGIVGGPLKCSGPGHLIWARRCPTPVARCPSAAQVLVRSLGCPVLPGGAQFDLQRPLSASPRGRRSPRSAR